MKYSVSRRRTRRCVEQPEESAGWFRGDFKPNGSEEEGQPVSIVIRKWSCFSVDGERKSGREISESSGFGVPYGYSLGVGGPTNLAQITD